MSDRKIIYLDDAIDAVKCGALSTAMVYGRTDAGRTALIETVKAIKALPSAQPEIIRCKDCMYYDPPHVEDAGIRYEYKDMPKDAFDELGTGLVHVGYGVNIGGRCCRDYNEVYSEDKRVFRREDDFCSRAERRIDETANQ